MCRSAILWLATALLVAFGSGTSVVAQAEIKSKADLAGANHAGAKLFHVDLSRWRLQPGFRVSGIQ